MKRTYVQLTYEENININEYLAKICESLEEDNQKILNDKQKEIFASLNLDKFYKTKYSGRKKIGGITNILYKEKLPKYIIPYSHCLIVRNHKEEEHVWRGIWMFQGYTYPEFVFEQYFYSVIPETKLYFSQILCAFAKSGEDHPLLYNYDIFIEEMHEANNLINVIKAGGEQQREDLRYLNNMIHENYPYLENQEDVSFADCLFIEFMKMGYLGSWLRKSNNKVFL